ncbi:MAG: hypothetical protein IKT79_06685 [Akkermansia sp.]|nr:hypothetical protein [Akkermansia sp.]
MPSLYRNIVADTTTAITVQANKTPANAINWYTMYAKQKQYKIEDEAVGSTMINGAAYDQVIKFVATDKNYDPYNPGQVGHEKDKINGSWIANGTTFTTKPYLTGGLEYNGYNTNYSNATNIPYRDVAKSIYDLEGNVCAWTTEASNTYTRVFRGRWLQLRHFSFFPQRQHSR